MSSLTLNAKLATARIVVVLASFVFLLFSLFYFYADFKILFYILFFTSSILLTDLLKIDIPSEGTITASTALILAAIFIGSQKLPLAVIMLSILLSGIASSLLSKKKPLNLLLRASQRIIAASFAASAIELWLLLGFNLDLFWWKLGSTLTAAAVYFIAERAVELLVNSTQSAANLKIVTILKLRLLALVYFTFTVIAMLMAMMFKWMDFWSILVFSLPLAVTSQSFRLYLDIRNTYASTIKALSAAIEAQDSKREGHAQRVTSLCLAIGKELGFYGESLQRLSYAAMLHDIGKLGFDKSTKKQAESDISPKKNIPFHAQIGAEIISHVDYLKDVSQIIKYHHYPFSSKKVDIPLEARVIHLANSFDHLTKDFKLNKKEALDKLMEDKGIIYDPKALRAFTKVLKKDYSDV